MRDLWKISGKSVTDHRPLEDLWKTCERSLEEEKKVSGRFFRSYEWTHTDESFYVTSWCGIQQWSFGCRDEPCAKYVRAHRAPCDIWPSEAIGCEWTWCRSITRLWRSLGRGQQENLGLSFAPVSSATVFPGGSDGSGNSSGTWQTGQSATASAATFGMPPGFLDVSGQPASGAAVPPVASNMDPVVLQMMRQQMLLTQSMMDFMTRSAQSTVPPMPGAQVPASSGQGASSGSAPSEKLTMDTKWIPAAPLPDWKSWSSRARELAGFKGWLEKFASWLCLVHDSYAAELKEALDLPYPVLIVNQDQAIRSRRLFHLLQQSFSGYSRVDNVVKAQISFYGIQEANGFELLRMLRREFSLMSRPEALQYREACLKFTVKKADRHLLLDVLREVSVEVESFHSMLEASLISAQLTDLRISEGDQYLLYLRNLPEKVQEFAQLHCAGTTVTKLWEAVNSYYVRMRITGDLDKVHVAQGKPAAATGSEVVCHNCGRKGHIARECPQPSAATAANPGTWPRIVGVKIHQKGRVEHQRQNQRQLPSLLLLPKGKEKAAEAKSKDVAEVSFEK